MSIKVTVLVLSTWAVRTGSGAGRSAAPGERGGAAGRGRARPLLCTEPPPGPRHGGCGQEARGESLQPAGPLNTAVNAGEGDHAVPAVCYTAPRPGPLQPLIQLELLTWPLQAPPLRD